MNAASWIGPLVGLVIAAGGWLAGRRKTRADTADMITEAAGKVVTQVTADYERLAHQVADLRAELDLATQRVTDAEERAARAEATAAQFRSELANKTRTIAAQATELEQLRQQLAALQATVESNGHLTGEHPVVPPSAT